MSSNQKHSIQVTNLHTLNLIEAGRSDGFPVLFIHGGPGAGCSTEVLDFFDLNFYRVFLLDQRGCGESTPLGETKENTTWDLVEDLELIRQKFDLSQVLLFGGSWGSTLSLAYAETYPKHVAGMILRGIFLCRPSDVQWFYQKGADAIYPQEFKDFISVLNVEERADVISAYYKIFTDANSERKQLALEAWARWEASTLYLENSKNKADEWLNPSKALSLSTIECHYFQHNSWLDQGRGLLENALRLPKVPSWIIHGRYDVICPITQAYDLHEQMPWAKFIAPIAGHSAHDPAIARELKKATEEFKAKVST